MRYAVGDEIYRIPSASEAAQTTFGKCAVPGVKLYKLPRFKDLRGDLSVGEFRNNFPFEPKRYFLVYDVPGEETRGQHAHRTCEQLLVCVSGSVTAIVDDGSVRDEVRLDSPHLGLYIPPRVWGIQRDYSPGSVLLVFASQYYDPQDYISSYTQFAAECRPAA